MIKISNIFNVTSRVPKVKKQQNVKNGERRHVMDGNLNISIISRVSTSLE